MSLTILEKVLDTWLKKGDVKVRVDFSYPKLKRAYYDERNRISKITYGIEIKIGKWRFAQVMNDYKIEYYKINMTKFCDDRGYDLRYNGKYLVAVKQTSLDLFGND